MNDGPTIAAARIFTRWARALEPGDIPAAASRAAIRHLLDGVGCAIGGYAAGVTDSAVDVAAALGGPAEATIIGRSGRVGAPAAALANGALVHALDFDDTHAGGLVHATAMVLPTLLAVGEQVDADGPTALTAAVAGYELACRLAAVVPNGFHERGLHPTAACGVFSAALVASLLTGLSEDETVAALGIAGSMAGGLLEFLNTGSATKQLHPGLAAHGGILAARLAAAGATGPDTVLEGRYGLYQALLGRTVTTEDLVAGLGEQWEVTRITIKPYPACQLMHVTLDAAARAVSSGPPVTVPEIVAIDADVHPDSAAIVCEPLADKLHPRSPYDAKFSLPWSVAALLIDGGVGTATYLPQSIVRTEVADLATRVRVHVTDSDTVAADAAGHVTLTLADGTTRSGTIGHSGGGPDAPLPDSDLDAKFLRNCSQAVADEAAHVISLVRGLDRAPSVRDLVERISALAARSAGNIDQEQQ